MPIQTASANFLPTLSIYRLVAAILILCAHAATWLYPQASGTPMSIRLGGVAAMSMSAFFTLSGFVIHYTYADRLRREWRKGVRAFYVARFSKIYPVYWIMLIVALLTDGNLSRIIQQPQLAAWLPIHLAGAQNWFFSPTDGLKDLFPLSWAVSVELFCYAAYPALLLIVGRLDTRRKILLFMVAVICISSAWMILVATAWPWLYPAFKTVFFYPSHMSDDAFAPLLLLWLTYCSPIVRLPEFLLGMLTAQLLFFASGRQEARGPSRSLWMATAVAYILLTALALSGQSFFMTTLRNAIVFAAPAASLLYLLCRDSNYLCDAISSPWITKAAQITYCLFMVQYFTLNAFQGYCAYIINNFGIAPWLASLMVPVAVTALAAHALYITVEVHAHRFLRKRMQAH